jgi:hypothetical protein
LRDGAFWVRDLAGVRFIGFILILAWQRDTLFLPMLGLG